MSAIPYTQRLDLARRMLTSTPPKPPIGLADQLVAAVRATRNLIDETYAVLDETDRWKRHDHASTNPDDPVVVALTAGLLGIEHWCCRLRRGGPQPAVIDLARRRGVCRHCVGTYRRPVVPADQCDMCDQVEVTTFTPIAVQHGPLLITGDVCEACMAVLGDRNNRRRAWLGIGLLAEPENDA